jgi:endonuclease-8
VPEGDTVWRTARSLDRALTGQVLVTTDFRVPEIATVDLSGQHVEATIARGKHLLTRIGADHTLHTHLKMEGSWHLYRPGTRWRRPTHQARVVLATDDWTAVGFSLGVTELVARGEEESVVGHLGPDLLGPDWDETAALARLTADPDRPLVEALLDQRNLAGIGNMYAAELCFLAGVPPHTRVVDVPGLPRLVRRARALLEANKERAQQATTGDLRRGRTHYVYSRAGQPCRRCRTRIQQGTYGAPPRERVTFWCPTCQPG